MAFSKNPDAYAPHIWDIWLALQDVEKHTDKTKPLRLVYKTEGQAINTRQSFYGFVRAMENAKADPEIRDARRREALHARSYEVRIAGKVLEWVKKTETDDYINLASQINSQLKQEAAKPVATPPPPDSGYGHFNPDDLPDEKDIPGNKE